MDVGVIGVGAMGKNHARVYSELKSVGNLHLFDLNTKAAEELGKKVDAHVVSSMDEILDSCEAVSICVPTPYHYKVASEVIDRHVAALIEKPICLTSEEATALVRRIPEDLTVGVGHIERFNAIIEELARIVRHPCYMEISRHNPGSARVTGSTVVEDLMIHDIDLIFSLIPVESWSVQCSGNADVASALFTINDNPVFLSASRKASKKVRSIYIEEEEFTVEGDFMNQEIYIHHKPGRFSLENERYTQDSFIEKVLVNKSEPLKRELSTFLDCVRSGKKFPVTPEQGLFNLQVCEKITRNFVKAA
jgi:predicted dehydrogenase